MEKLKDIWLVWDLMLGNFMIIIKMILNIKLGKKIVYWCVIFECPPPCISNCSQICKPIRLKFKNILDKNLNECGEFYTVDTPKLLCLCSKRTYEIRFPNDANVSMKLLLLGGLFEAIFMPYGSNP